MSRQNNCIETQEVAARLVDARCLAQMFSPPRCERTIRNWQSANVVPFYKIGRAVLFDPTEVFEHLSKHNRVAPRGVAS